MDINKLLALQSKCASGGGISLIISKVLCRYIRLRYQCDIPYTFKFEDIYLCHQGFGVVITPKAKIGKDTYIQHGVTIGVNEDTQEAPIIGTNVRIGAQAVIIGGVHIGDNAIIGAGSVVVHNVPDNASVVGVPAKVIKINGKRV